MRATTGLLKIFSFPEFFAAAAERLAKLLGADGVALIVYEEPGQLRYKLFHGLEQLNQTPIVKFSFSASQGTVGRALASGQALFTPDYPVIPPFLTGLFGRIHAASFNFWAGVIPPIAIFGRSLL